ncbi:serine hydrolase domain-containing protein [Ilumatobacter nonamiensis]|uniref:serine hydrolase domain-containing protein n=1 Tax=Ilumatobacter nonamiensis TaxID=467093 RepID=UPI00034CBECE|nr:serine hydrolase domain-containing protein [Ilumatobacter nonamiensis]
MRSIPRRSLAALACGALVLAACGSDDDADGGGDVELAFELPTDEMSDEDAAALVPIDEAVAADPTDLQESETPGFLYGVWDADTGVHLAAAGLSEIDDETAMATDMSFRIGSITKTFTATAVLLLVDDGEVDLDEPVATYTGDLTTPLPGGDTTTVRQALSMLSGWPEYSNDPEGPFAQQLEEPDHEFTAEELVAAAAGEEPTSTDDVTYVNTNFIVLGELVEEVSGGSFSDFVQERILGPVGLENTVIPDQTETAPTVTHGYLNASWADFDTLDIPDETLNAASSGEDVTEMSTSVGGTAGNGVSTLEDLAIWAAADFGNVLLSESSQEARLDGNPAENVLPGSEYGLGIQLIGDWHGHGGEIFGWESQVFANPTTGQVVVTNTNACCGLGLSNILTVTSSFPDDEDLTAATSSILGLDG